MSALRCNLVVDNQRAVYQPGDALSGRVVLTIDERVLIKAFAFRISGYACVHWEKLLPPKKQKQNKKETKQKQKQQTADCATQPAEMAQSVEVYSNREDFISSTNYFIGSEEAIPKAVDRGVYSYPFAVSLPRNCPSSLESVHGHVRYMLEAFADLGDSRRTCATLHLPLVKAFDLRHDASLQQAFDVSVEENKSFVKFWQHPLQLHLNVPQLGYAPGEPITVHVRLQNESQLCLSELTYTLNLVGTYVGVCGKKKPKTKVARTALVKSVHALSGRNDSLLQHLQVLHVPQQATPTMPPTDCRILHVGYEVEVWLSTANAKRAVSAQLPITVGTVSLRSAQPEKQPLSRPEAAFGSRPEAAFGSRPTLLVATSMNDLSFQPAERGAANVFGVATAPAPETPHNLSTSMMSLASSFREADFMATTNLNKNCKGAMSSEQLDYKPKYLYYNMENQVQHAEISSTSMSGASSDQLRVRQGMETAAEQSRLQQGDQPEAGPCTSRQAKEREAEAQAATELTAEQLRAQQAQDLVVEQLKSRQVKQMEADGFN